jgi:light-regulated signal transduction histidine kinase (bacteriophytochrome)
MSAAAVDLAHCAGEPIRVPGAIQPHGWLAVLDGADGALVAYSENWAGLLGVAAGRAEAGLAEALHAMALPRDGLVEGEGPISRGTVTLSGRLLHVAAHRLGGLVHLEFEPAADDPGTRAPIYTLARHLVPRMQRTGSAESLCAVVAEEMKRLTGFGRCLVYRFDAEGHGEVLAEALDDGYDSYAGHRFPASDIPAQARELYRLNHIRLIPDAHYAPVPVRFVAGRGGDGPLDMSQAALRSVSPIHLEYMRNMGTLASMSVSIIVGGALWGLVSCHDHAPRTLRYPTRMACEHLGQLLSLQIEAKEENERVAQEGRLRQLTLAMVAHLADSDATLQRLVDEPGPLLRLTRATGAAVILNEQCWTVGDVPDAEALARLGPWLAGRIEQETHSDRLASLLPGFAGQMHAAAGLLAISISRLHRHYIVWFRPEIVQTIDWAGDPRKEPQPGRDGRLHPRRSFATWREDVGGRSLPWSAAEVNAALELRQALIGIVLRRAEELAEVATELGRVNKELEAFSYTVSHDLRAPMRHIAGFVDLVRDLEGAKLGERSQRYLTHVKEASAHAGQLVDALLDFSRMGRSALKHTVVDTEQMVDDLVAELATQDRDRRIEWRIERPLPALWGDAVLLQMAVRNLLSNAVKYSRPREVARITVRGTRGAEGDGLEIGDNGVGFQMKYVGKLFGVFQRLHDSEAFEGTGIGLASVRRIVERHGGRVSAWGEPDRGARFTLVLPGRDALPLPLSSPSE